MTLRNTEINNALRRGGLNVTYNSNNKGRQRVRMQHLSTADETSRSSHTDDRSSRTPGMCERVRTEVRESLRRGRQDRSHPRIGSALSSESLPDELANPEQLCANQDCDLRPLSSTSRRWQLRSCANGPVDAWKAKETRKAKGRRANARTAETRRKANARKAKANSKTKPKRLSTAQAIALGVKPGVA